MNTQPPVPLYGFVQVERFGIPCSSPERRCPICGWRLAEAYDGDWCRACYMGLDDGGENEDERFDKAENMG